MHNGRSWLCCSQDEQKGHLTLLKPKHQILTQTRSLEDAQGAAEAAQAEDVFARLNVEHLANTP